MRLNYLRLTNFRNISSLTLEPDKRINLIQGSNGSGKTSILEAIYLLSIARSFRTHLLSRAIQYEADSFSIVGSVQGKKEGVVKIGIEKHRKTKPRIKVNNEEGASLATLARMLPVKLINPDSYSLLNEGPKFRRQFLDWGLFHVEQKFFPVWQRFQRILKQRNAALQQKLGIKQVDVWNNEFVETAIGLAELRRESVQRLLPLIAELIKRVFKIQATHITYYPGWDEEKELSSILTASYPRDSLLGYTQFGPHRADIELKMEGLPVQDVLSRGEQKILVYLLHLAQGDLFRRLNGKSCIYLFDDLSAELDDNHRKILIDNLMTQESQIFITSIDKNVLIDNNSYSLINL